MADVRKNEAQHQYEVTVDGQVAGFAKYEPRGNAVIMPHTEVQPQYEGQGLGQQLAQFALNDIRAAGQKVVPQCPFIADYIQKHPEYADLVAE